MPPACPGGSKRRFRPYLGWDVFAACLLAGWPGWMQGNVVAGLVSDMADGYD